MGYPTGQGITLQKDAAVPLVPLTEYVGEIIEVTDDRITLEAKWHLSIMITPGVLKRSKKLIRKAAHVGILVLEDGSIRVRTLPNKDCSIFDSFDS